MSFKTYEEVYRELAAQVKPYSFSVSIRLDDEKNTIQVVAKADSEKVTRLKGCKEIMSYTRYIADENSLLLNVSPMSLNPDDGITVIFDLENYELHQALMALSWDDAKMEFCAVSNDLEVMAINRLFTEQRYRENLHKELVKAASK